MWLTASPFDANIRRPVLVGIPVGKVAYFLLSFDRLVRRIVIEHLQSLSCAFVAENVLGGLGLHGRQTDFVFVIDFVLLLRVTLPQATNEHAQRLVVDGRQSISDLVPI